MRFRPPGHFRTAEEFRAHLRTVDPRLDCDVELQGADGPLGRPVSHAGRTLTNRFAVHPMEGWDGTPEGLPTELTLRRWRRFGRSGAKLIWGGEAFAVAADGRANPNQLFLNDDVDTRSGLAELRRHLFDGHAEIGENPDELLVGLQLTHSGRFARPGKPAPRTAVAHPVLDTRFGVDPARAILTDAELEEIAAAFVRAASAAREVGFDFVDVKCCHGYLLHELLGARGRPGPYGGSFENRTRFFREVVAGIRGECPGLEVAVRVSLADVFPHARDEETDVGAPRGWQDHVPYEHGFGVDPEDPRRFDMGEPHAFLGLVQELGIRLVNVSLGSPYYSPHLQRPAAYPPSDGYQPPRDPLVEVGEHVCAVRDVKRAFPGLVVVGTGYSYLQEYLPHVAQYEVGQGNVDFVGLGRMVLSYPELPRDVLAGKELDRRRICRTFSDCTTGPRNELPSGCYPLDPFYRERPEAEVLRRVKKGGV